MASKFFKETLDVVSSSPYAAAVAGVVVVGTSLYLLRRYFAGGVCYSKATLTGKTVIITGANTGIGLETAVDMAQRGARVILACRSAERGSAALEVVKKRSKSEDVALVLLDLTSLQSVRDFAAKILKEEPRIDILINNAGVYLVPYSKTKDGFELTFQVNHLSHFLLTNLLLDRLKEAPSARIINVSSMGHQWGKINFDDILAEKSYNKYQAYYQSKLANVLFSRSLAQRLKGTNVTAYSLHPGAVATELERDWRQSFFVSVTWI